MAQDPHREGEDGVAVEEGETELSPPPMYRVFLINDDYTPMDFVVDVLERFFHMARERAIQVMLQVHNDGEGECGVYPRDIAESQVARVNRHARSHQHPLMCSLQRID
jgi:ATP-dependent Clp protease adaptor protein ClpS